MKWLRAAPLDMKSNHIRLCALYLLLHLFWASLLKDNKGSSSKKVGAPTSQLQEVKGASGTKTVCPHRDYPNSALCSPSPHLLRLLASFAFMDRGRISIVTFPLQSERGKYGGHSSSTGYKCPRSLGHMNSNLIMSILHEILSMKLFYFWYLATEKLIIWLFLRDVKG